MELKNAVRIAGAGAAVVIIVGLAAFTVTFLPAKLRIPRVDVGELPPPSRLRTCQ